MKKLITLSVLFLLMITVKGQITLEHTYDSSEVYSAGNPKLSLINLAASGHKYAIIDVNNAGSTLGGAQDTSEMKITLYNMDHSLYKTIVIPPFWDTLTSSIEKIEVSYISEHLFNSDDDIEYLISWSSNNNAFNYLIKEGTIIFNEFGNVLFYKPKEILIPSGDTYHNQSPPIFNTPNGTKLVLKNYDYTFNNEEYKVKVYSLPGNLSTSMRISNENSIESTQVKAYPNPSNGGITFEYDLIENYSTANIKIYNISGQLEKSIPITNQNGAEVFDSKSLSPATYYYIIETDNNIIKGDKLIIIE